MNPSLRNTRTCSALLGSAAILLGALFASASAQTELKAPHWVGSWTASPCAPDDVDRATQMALNGTTVRQVVHLSAGGLAVRLRFSNAYGSAPLVLRSAHIAHAAPDGLIDPASDQPVLFKHNAEVTIAPGASVLSDSVQFVSAASSDQAITFFVPGKLNAPAVHYTALQTSYVAPGDQTTATTLKDPRKITLDLILTAVDVASRTSPGAVVALGSSTTDGAHSTPNLNHRWTDVLFSRLGERDAEAAPAVLNAGISGNRVLTAAEGDWGPVFGEPALARYYRDVLEQAGVHWIIVFEGGNDIRLPPGRSASAAQLIKAYGLMAQQARARHLKFFLATITPSEGTGGTTGEQQQPAWEAVRLAVNQWIRSTKDVDGVLDFDAATRDPAHPARLLPSLDSGDHLHPNDLGYKRMADAIDLNLFR